MSAQPVVPATSHIAGHLVTESRWATPLQLLLLGAIWGGSFLFMRVATRDFGPLALVEVRLVLGAAVLSPFLWRARSQFTKALWLKAAGIGALNSAIPFALFAWAARLAPAGIGAICNATAVMFTAFFAFVLYGERFSTRRVIGLIAGFCGVVVLASGKTSGSSVLSAAIAGTTAAAFYGISANLIRRHLTGLPSSAVAGATLATASVLLLPAAVLTWPTEGIALTSWGSAIALGVLCTGVAYLIYYRLIYKIGAPRASTVTYLVPLFGVLWAWMLLSEPLTLTMLVAGALILGGVAINQGTAPNAK
jgi:drug/metabolite transporter (DMT)-like permease